MDDVAPSGIELIPAFRWGAHICQAFERADDLQKTLVPYFAAGLKNNEACLWVTAAPLSAATFVSSYARVSEPYSA